MRLRASLHRLESAARKRFGGPGMPCRCQPPLPVIYDHARGIMPEEPEGRCASCGGERDRINVNIVMASLPGQAVGAGPA